MHLPGRYSTRRDIILPSVLRTRLPNCITFYQHLRNHTTVDFLTFFVGRDFGLYLEVHVVVRPCGRRIFHMTCCGLNLDDQQ